MHDPKLYLAVDNCFAKKRWTSPAEWFALLQRMGIVYVEASADNECDPLYMTESYMKDWRADVKKVQEQTGVRVANLYSGHGTYTTLGLTHNDKSVRERMLNGWLKPMASYAAELGAGLGFYCHGFSDSVLQDPVRYAWMERELYEKLAELAVYCRELGMAAPGLEQMYSPQQVPWTVQGAENLLKEVRLLSGSSDFYLSLDTGHQSGQRKFLRPSPEAIRETAAGVRRGTRPHGFWLGPQSAYSLFSEMTSRAVSEEASYLARIENEMDRYPYLFAQEEDGDTYGWLRRLGCYSPILHLQQTTGTVSAHHPFTEEYNRSGIVFGAPVLQALAEAYRQPDEADMPPKSSEVYLTLELFAGTAELNSDILWKLEQSVHYWRQFVPEDGIRLSEALRLLDRADSGEAMYPHK
jgi:sugar phosphate isomerase/epimerase